MATSIRTSTPIRPSFFNHSFKGISDEKDVMSLKLAPENLHVDPDSIRFQKLLNARVLHDGVSVLGVVKTPTLNRESEMEPNGDDYTAYIWNLSNGVRTHLFSVKSYDQQCFLSPTHIIFVKYLREDSFTLESWEAKPGSPSTSCLSQVVKGNLQTIVQTPSDQITFFDHNSLKFHIFDMALNSVKSIQLTVHVDDAFTAELKSRGAALDARQFRVNLLSDGRLFVNSNTENTHQIRFSSDSAVHPVVGNEMLGAEFFAETPHGILLSKSERDADDYLINYICVTNDFVRSRPCVYAPPYSRLRIQRASFIESPNGDFCIALMLDSFTLNILNNKLELIGRKKIALTDSELIPKTCGDHSSLLILTNGEIRGGKYWLERLAMLQQLERQVKSTVRTAIDPAGNFPPPLADIMFNYLYGTNSTTLKDEKAEKKEVSRDDLTKFITHLITYFNDPAKLPNVIAETLRVHAELWAGKYEQPRRERWITALTELLGASSTKTPTEIENSLLALINDFIHRLKLDKAVDKSVAICLQSFNEFIFNVCDPDIALSELTINDLCYRIHHQDTLSPGLKGRAHFS